MQDMWTTVANGRAVLADDLRGLTDAQWDTPSLCHRWTVREVVAHQSGTAALSVGGRAEACDHLTGEGVATLRSRCA